MHVFRASAAVHLTEEAVVSRAFAIPAGARAASQRFLTRSELIRDESVPVHYRRPQDHIGGLPGRYVVRAVIGIVVAVLVVGSCRRLGAFHGSSAQPVVTSSVLGLSPVVVLLWREGQYRRRRSGPRRSGDDPE